MKKRFTTLFAAALICSCAVWGQQTLTIPEPVKMSAPAWNGKVKPGVGVKTILLKCIGQKYAEPTIYLDKWREEKGLELTHKYKDAGNERIPAKYNGLELNSEFTGGDYPIYVYGDTYDVNQTVMIITDRECQNVKYSIDLSSWAHGPKEVVDPEYTRISVGYAMVENGILYIGHWHRTFADSSQGKNGYITAIDLATMKQLWTTLPLTCNSSFDITGNSIVCGYGFTDEPDFVYVVDKTTGKRKQTIKVLNGPDDIVVKGKRVYVRTYSYDYLFTFK